MQRIATYFFLGSFLVAYHGGPPAGNANNAPSFNNCTSCHAGSANSGDGSVVFTGLPTEYTPGTTYEVTLTVSGTNNGGFGFQAAAQSGDNSSGSFSLNNSSSDVELNGDYIQQSDRTTSGQWIFDWLAPSTDEGDITFSASGLAAGYSSGNDGDEVYTVSMTVPAATPMDLSGLFFSEYAEGSSNNKYLEIYNGTGEDLDLSNYSLSSCSNGCDTNGQWDYPDNVTFPSGTILTAGDVFVVYHQDADEMIEAEGDQTFTYLSNGNDAFAITEAGATADTYTIIDIIGDMSELELDDGWDVAGVTSATKNHTLVRKASVVSNNGGNWSSSAGTNDTDSEWIVLDQNTWTYLGSHPHEISGPTPTIVVNEFLAGSETCCGNDIFGQAEDFVEIYNYGEEAVDITGWGFSDIDGTITTIAPDTSIPAGDFLLLWYTGDNNGFPEVNEELSSDGETIYIADASGNTVVSLDFGAQSNDISYGRVPDGGDNWAFLDPPSPGSTNETLGDITAIYDIQFVADPSSDDTSPLYQQEVTIRGVVTSEFWGSDDRKYMNVQDAVGPWNGIVCYEEDGWDQFDWVDVAGNSVPGPGEGDEVTLTGTVEEYYNLTELIDVSSGIVHGESDQTIAPSVLSLGEIGEAHEGCLVRVEDVVVSDPDLGYGEWEISNSSGSVRCDNKWEYYYFPETDHELASVVGVLDYSFSNYKIQPRLARDVVEETSWVSGLPTKPTRIQRIQQVLYSDLMKAGEDELSDFSYSDGDTVLLEGVVTMPVGLSYAGDGVKFILSDLNGGPWSAILAYDPAAGAFGNLIEGDLIRVAGYIGEYSTGPANMTELFIIGEIDPYDFTETLPPVSTVKTGDLRWPTTAEQWGNVMVRVEDAVVDGNDYQYEVFSMDDGTGSVLVDDDSDSIQVYFDTYGPPPLGSLVQSMEGWVYHHYGSYTDSSAYKLCPLYAEDMVFGAGPPSISAVVREPCAPTSQDTEVSVSCVILDNSTITSALIHYSIDGGDYQTSAMYSNADSLWTGTIPVSNNNDVNYYITATDDGQDQSEPKTSMFPFDVEREQMGFVVTDNLTIEHIQKTAWPSGTTRYQGCEVTLSGIVTADTSQYLSGYSSYVFQDGSGQWSGLVFDTQELVILSRGDNVNVTGFVEDFDPDWHFKFDGNTRLINSTVVINSSGNNLPSPSLISCSDVALGVEDSNPESYEGVLVKMNQVTISMVNSFDWTITDASGAVTLIDDDMATMSADNLMSEFIEGQELEYVSGIFNYSYGTFKIQIRDLDDIGQALGINDEATNIAYNYSLHDNYPNPFNPETHIRFELGAQENVKLMIYDALGRQVRTLVYGQSFSPGIHAVNWDGRNNKGQAVPSGVYIYRIKAGSYIADKKMMLIK